ncbi:MAG: hypothetical protein MJY79_04880 [Bacteroidaceae bacterium]|nr:hypothetical protein [Bacteroidaceae bacterium]
MKHINILLILASALLVSCQTTNFTDLIDYSQIGNKKAAMLEKKGRLRFDRKAALIDDQDNIIENRNVRKGTEITVQGFVHRYIGNKKFAPHFFRDNYTPRADAWLVLLPNGSRAFMEVPEMAIGVKGKNGEMVTDVKDQPNSLLYLYKTTASEEWTEDPAIEYAAKQDVAVYFPIRHFKPFVGDKKYEDCEKWWSKALYRLGGPIDFLSSHRARHILYNDGVFYRYHPVIMMSDKVGRLVQLILSGILLFLVLAFAVPWLAVRTVWRIPFLSNGMVKFLAFILAAIYFILFAAFLGVDSWGYIFWILFAGFGIKSYVKIEIDFNRCPYCHKLGLSYDGTTKGNWSSKDYARSEKVEVGRDVREYDRPAGYGYEHVKETTIHTKTNKYIDTFRVRSTVDHLHCLHCHRPIDLHDTEEETTTRQVN